MQRIKNLWRLMRPSQWTKNSFVFVGLIFGHAWDDHLLAWHVVLIALAFSLISSTVYVVNDILDAENDRLHPKKRNRPIASGAVTIGEGIILASLLACIGLSLGLFVSYKVMVILLLYLALNAAYSLSWKHIVILDVFCIACGFMLRILAGTVGIGIPPSRWLLMCGMMLTLFLGFAKRRAEIINLSKEQKDFREVLEQYDPVVLDEFIAISAAGVILTYSLYTMSPETALIHKTGGLIYTVPFVIYGIFRYIYMLHSERKAGEPARDLFQDPHIVSAVFSWAAVTITVILKNAI
jgi:4-hydroxybenzoate polyprenyltransferase